MRSSTSSNERPPTAWVTGAAGLMGHHLVQAAPRTAPGWTVLGLTRPRLELTDFKAVEAAFHHNRPQLIIHCAAMTRTADCQKNPGLARQINIEITARLAELAADISFIFLSTDLVFDGQQGHYDESAMVNPLTIYGETKAAAERVVLANPRHTILRTSLNFGASPTGDRAFNEDLRRAWASGQTVRLFNDEFRNPIAAEATARFIWELALQKTGGLYHLAGAERLSRLEIGQLLAARWPTVVARMESVSLRDYQGPPRAPDTTLNCAKAQRRLSTALPRFSDWLAAHPETLS